MGFLEAGTPMEWYDSEEYFKILEYVRKHGVIQFLETWKNVKSRKNDSLLWGDEIEFHIYKSVIVNNKRVLKLTNTAHSLLKKLEHEDEKLPENERNSTWHPEYGAWMIEATPSNPYGGFSDELRRVEPNMRARRYRITKALEEGEGVLTMVAWPLMGVNDFAVPLEKAGGNVSESLFIPDSCINPHPRFATLTRNIRKRRGQKVHINLPLFIDENTLKPGGPADIEYEIKSKDNLGTETVHEIYMDAMGFGMGCCCLQVTFQARDLDESRHLYDQLSVLCPIFLALTAGAPIFKGLLCDTDIRWSTIAQSVDCRTPIELGATNESTIVNDGSLPQRGKMQIRKSRYDSVDIYMSTSPLMKDEYNDVNTEIDEETFKTLILNGVDERLARHIGHLYIRDPLVIFSDRIEVDDKTTTEHFENIQSTNWQTMRWKPPPPNAPKMGWRVEFRPMEVQFSDFENAAFTVVITLIARVILFFDLNLYIPISKVDENMKRAHSRDAVLNQKFYFRKNLIPLETQCDDNATTTSTTTTNNISSVNNNNNDANKNDISSEYTEMTVREIILGKGTDFPGIVPLIWAYLDIIGVDPESRSVIDDYILLIVERAKGDLPTPARWIRNFVNNHSDYKKDSIISETIARDLVEEITSIANGKKQDETLLGTHKIVPLDTSAENDTAELKKTRNNGMRLRGASFQSDVGMTKSHAYQCAIVRALVEKYSSETSVNSEHIIKLSNGFFGASSFLSSKLATTAAANNVVDNQPPLKMTKISSR